MHDRSLSEFKSFSGFLHANGRDVPVTFQARINRSGEVEFDFDKIAITNETSFLLNRWNLEKSILYYFSLTGKSEDGTEFTTENLNFSIKISDHIILSGSKCSRAKFLRKLAEPKPKPWLCMLLKGFRSSHPLVLECHLGAISMVEFPDVETDAITGFIIVKSGYEPIDPSAWHTETNKLLEHILQVMSFASGVMLRAPIIEFYSGDKLEIVVSSEIQQASSTPIPVFLYEDQQSIFKVAVASFISPPIVVKNLLIAIEWFVMDSSYGEVRLINAMTVLENLVASNLVEEDTLILKEKKEFEKYRRTLRKVLKQCIKKWPTDYTKKPEDILSDINERLADLNRRSILQKLDTLAKHWSVPLEGISKEKINAAKKARDLIVHQGHYYEGSNDLWEEHVMVVREIAIRFLFTAIGYKGRYISHLGGFHEAQFPPDN